MGREGRDKADLNPPAEVSLGSNPLAGFIHLVDSSAGELSLAWSMMQESALGQGGCTTLRELEVPACSTEDSMTVEELINKLQIQHTTEIRSSLKRLVDCSSAGRTGLWRYARMTWEGK